MTPPASLPAWLARSGGLLAGKYRLEGVVGSGGMGVVVAATHVQLRERVAIKVLRPELACSGPAVRRFRREAQATSKLRSEHAVRVFDVGTLPDGSPFLVMEYLEGEDLAALLRDGLDGEPGPLPIVTAVDWILQACEAVAEAHARRIVHRDLKPANLFRTRRADGSSCIKVLDFGVSKLLEPDADERSVTLPSSEAAPPGMSTALAVPALAAPTPVSPAAMTASGAALGSPRYMAPEQMQNARRIDGRVDVWALGAILFELLAGVPAFAGAGQALVREICDGPSPRVRRFRSDVPAGLDGVLRACLERDRERRTADVARLAEALAAYASPDGKRTAERVARVLRGSDAGGVASATRSPRASFVRLRGTAVLALGLVVAALAFVAREKGHAASGRAALAAALAAVPAASSAPTLAPMLAPTPASTPAPMPAPMLAPMLASTRMAVVARQDAGVPKGSASVPARAQAVGETRSASETREELLFEGRK